MRNWFGMCVLVLVTMAMNSSSATVNGFLDLKHGGMPYRLYVPENRDANAFYPLVLFLHGSGGRGDNNTSNIGGGNEAGSHLCTKPEVQAEHPCFVLAPQCPANQTWACSPWGSNNGYFSIDDNAEGPNITKALAVLDQVISQYNIDENRLYITGQSMGGGGTWETILRHPNRFAAAINVCGHTDTTKAALVRHMPIWIFHGLNDNTVKPLTNQKMFAALEALDAPHVKATWYPSDGHQIWNKAYATTGLTDWLFSFSRATTGRKDGAVAMRRGAMSPLRVHTDVSGQLRIFREASEAGMVSARLFGLDGRVYGRLRAAEDAGVFLMDVRGIATGAYLLRLDSPRGSEAVRLMLP